MRALFVSTLLVLVAVLFLGGAQGGEKEGKEVTLKGTITCAKCDLGKEAKCATVIVAKDKSDKETVYYFDSTASKKYHGKVCQQAHQGTVTGTVSTEGEKHIITVKKATIE